jgi:hypothetical protein
MKKNTYASTLLFVTLMLSQASLVPCRMPSEDVIGNNFHTQCDFNYRNQPCTQEPQRTTAQRKSEQKVQLNSAQKNRINVLNNQITGNKSKK